MIKIIKVKKGELAVLYKNGEIQKALEAGHYRFIDLLNTLSHQVIDLNVTKVATKTADLLISFYPEIIVKHCTVVVLEKNEIVLRYEEQKIVEVLLPQTKNLYWRGYKEQAFKRIVLDKGYTIPEEIVLELIKAKTSNKNIVGIDQLTLDHLTHEQVGALFVDNQLASIIKPASTIGYCRFEHEILVGKHSLVKSNIEEVLADAIEQVVPEQMKEFCLQMEVSANQVGLRYEDDLLIEILPPGTRRLYWKNNRKQYMVTINLDEGYTLSDEMVEQLLQPALRKKEVVGDSSVLIAQIPAYHVGVLRVNGKVEQLLEAGITAYWRFNREVSVEIVDTRLQMLEVAGQEILTKDKVNLRVNLVANWHYSDVLVAFEKVASPKELLYRELQFGLREAIGTRTLDELLENKNIIDEVVSTHIKQKMVGYGVQTVSLGVRDIILPGDMKAILSQVVEAEKAAQANVIRRREETSATRSLLNTAKVMENNPVALRLKEMETLERIAERIDKISVVGGLDQVLHGLINIQPKG
ncbi:slipin family protein [Entomomonas moraniae]